MAYRYVVQVGDEVLRTKCEEVRRFDSELAALLDDMKETVRKEDGAGLAAPQIGVNVRVVVIDLEEGFFEMVNPKILAVKGEQRGEEGCLSVKGKYGIVTRPNKVKAEYRDRTGKKHTVTGTGLFARCMCHEFDHLDGILYIDKAEEVFETNPKKED
ncbi:MAG: peptide deformylase [Clostridia bacterium]|nr:peptide deformylase [Clostridia bacterium]MDE7256349.1 peptide deformylase [Clostridia bacterium]